MAIDYLKKLVERRRDIDNIYGVRKLSKDRLMIGDSSLSLNKNLINIGNTVSYPKNCGLACTFV